MVSHRAPLMAALVLCSLLVFSLQGLAQPEPQVDSRLARMHSFSRSSSMLSELLQAFSCLAGVALCVERTVAQHRAILLALATSFTEPMVPLLERAALLVRCEERHRPEPPYEVPAGDEALQRIVGRFHSTPY